MKTEKQRIAIAWACGYTHIRIIKAIEGPPDIGIGHHPTEPHSIPDYLNDLNAMHEAEKALAPAQWQEYAMELRQIVQRDCNKLECFVPGAERSQLIADFWFYVATAAQRAKAFLKTIGKWEEEP